MKKKLLTLALTATMVLGSISSAFAGDKTEYEAGLIGYYTFDGTLDNAVGEGSAKLHGGAGDTWNAAVTGSATYETGKNGKSYKFLGDIMEDTTLKARGEGLELDAKVSGSEYTISAWIKASDFGSPTSSMIFANGDTTFSLNALNGFNGSTLLGKLWDWDNRGSLFVALDGDKDKFTLDQWIYVTVSSKSGEQKMYFNGVEQANAASTDAGVVDVLKNQSIFLGINWWDPSFAGLMDDVSIYDKVLSASEVKTLFDANGVPAGKEAETEEPTKDESPSGDKDPETEKPTKDESPSGEKDPETEKPTEEPTTVKTPEGAGVVTEDEVKAIAESAKVEGTNAPEGSKLVFTVIDKDDKAFEATNKFVTKNFADSAKLGKYAFFDISLVDAAGTKVQPLNNGKVKVTLNIKALEAFKAAKENDDVSVYRVSDDGAKIELITTAKVAADGTLSFDTDHFSKYLFVAGAPAKDIDDKDADGKTQTGDAAPIMLLALAALAACGTVAYVYVGKKRAK